MDPAARASSSGTRRRSVALWRQHGWVLTGLTEASGLVILAYILLARPPNAGGLQLLLLAGCALTPLLLLVPDRWYEAGYGPRVVLVWNVGVVVLISGGAALDTGPTSPLIWFNVLALSLASTVLRPRLVLAVAAAVVGGYLAVTASADEFGVMTLVVAFVLLAVAGTTTWVSRERFSELARLKALTVRLGAADADRERFVATTSHELRTPVASILGYVELLEDAADQPGADLGPHLRTVRRNAERLLDTTNGLLDLARSDDERLAAAMSDDQADVAKLAEHVIDTMTPLAAKQGVTLEMEVPHDVGTGAWVVPGSPEQLERVLLNLVSNGVKYTPDGGQVRCTLLRGADTVSLTVLDTGIGMAADDVERLFTRFFRARSAKDRSISGAGLGLSIVRDVVTDLGGDVDVTSSPGMGSRFTVQLPASKVQPAAGAHAPDVVTT